MKHYGIPYQGSKEKILNLIQYIFDREHEKEYMIDPFCGGFCVAQYTLEHTKFKVLANDLNKYVIALIREVVFNNATEIKKVWLNWISRQEFQKIKNNPDKYPDWYVGYVLTIWSFGNNQRGYLFGKEIEFIKKKLHNALVFNEWDEKFLWLKKLMPTNLTLSYTSQKRIIFMQIYKKAIKNRFELEQLQQLEQLEQLQRLEQLERLQQLEQLERLQEMDWFDFINSIPENILKKAFIYCDPPYQNTSKYQENNMNYEKFWNWFRACPYPVYVSSYTAPKDISIINFENKRKLNNPRKRTIAVENIYFNGKGKPAPTLLDLLFNT